MGTVGPTVYIMVLCTINSKKNDSVHVKSTDFAAVVELMIYQEPAFRAAQQQRNESTVSSHERAAAKSQQRRGRRHRRR